MRKDKKEVDTSIIPISLSEFLALYNKNMPENYPRASAALLNKFKESNSGLFKNGDMWSLDQHRKKLFEWLPRNLKTS